MNKLITLSAAAYLAFGLVTAVYAADDMKMKMDMHAGGDMKMNMDTTSPASMGAPLADGVVEKVDKQSGMITIKHGELKNVGMPPMTMAYKAKDAAMVKQAKESEKVKFRLENLNGIYTVTTLEKQ